MKNFITKVKDSCFRFFKKIKNINWTKVKTYLFGNGLKDGVLPLLVCYALLIVIAFVFIEPILDMFFTSFKSSKDLIDPEVIVLPKKWEFSNYKAAYVALDYLTTLFNSIWFSLLLAVIQTIVSALAGYALARYKIKGAKFWWGLLIAAFIIPAPMLILPRRIIFQTIFETFKIKLIGTLIPQIVLTLLGQGVYSTILVLICYSFFKQIPYDLDEAAYMDGANSAQVLWHVIIKLSLPVMLTVFLFSFVWNWNESVMTNNFIKTALELVPQKLAAFDSLFTTIETSGATDLNEGYKMAGTLLSILPLIILYIFVQRKFIEGIEQSGITGV